MILKKSAKQVLSNRSILNKIKILVVTPIVAIFATFLSTELYAFEVPVISYNKFSEGKNWENFKTIHVVCFSSAMLCIQKIICSITYNDDNGIIGSLEILNVDFCVPIFVHSITDYNLWQKSQTHIVPYCKIPSSILILFYIRKLEVTAHAYCRKALFIYCIT